jgi:hypothetical protein
MPRFIYRGQTQSTKNRRANVHSALGIAFTTPATSHQAKWLRDLLARTRELVRIDNGVFGLPK